MGDIERTFLNLITQPGGDAEIEKRPFYVTHDGNGKPIRELFT